MAANVGSSGGTATKVPAARVVTPEELLMDRFRSVSKNCFGKLTRAGQGIGTEKENSAYAEVAKTVQIVARRPGMNRAKFDQIVDKARAQRGNECAALEGQTFHTRNKHVSTGETSRSFGAEFDVYVMRAAEAIFRGQSQATTRDAFTQTQPEPSALEPANDELTGQQQDVGGASNNASTTNDSSKESSPTATAAPIEGEDASTANTASVIQAGVGIATVAVSGYAIGLTRMKNIGSMIGSGIVDKFNFVRAKVSMLPFMAPAPIVDAEVAKLADEELAKVGNFLRGLGVEDRTGFVARAQDAFSALRARMPSMPSMPTFSRTPAATEELGHLLTVVPGAEQVEQFMSEEMGEGLVAENGYRFFRNPSFVDSMKSAFNSTKGAIVKAAKVAGNHKREIFYGLTAVAAATGIFLMVKAAYDKRQQADQ